MSFDSNLLPDNIRRCMPQQERKKMRLKTTEEIAEKTAQGQELKLHKQIKSFCWRNNILYIYSRPDRRPTITKGWPDLTLLKDGKGCLIECKAEKGELSKDQIELLPEIAKANVPYLCTESYGEAIQFAIKSLNLKEEDLV